MKVVKFFSIAAAVLALQLTHGAQVQNLQFIKLNNVSGLNLPATNTYLGVAYDGVNQIMAVGSNEVFLAGAFVTNYPFINPTNFNFGTTRSSGTLITLTAIGGGPGQFVAIGDGNLVDVWSGSWANNVRAFGNSAQGTGLAYNNGQFVAVAAAPEQAYASLPVPNTAWTLVNNYSPALSFAESFRGVSSYSAGGFVSCGVFGVVRLSSSGPSGTWNKIRTGGTTQADLLGVTSDGNQTFVAVGGANPTVQNGNTPFITVSANGGGSWTDFTPTSGSSGAPLRSAAFIGAGYVVVGTKGQVLTSSDGSAWSTNPVAMALAGNADLNGITFGSSGSLQGLGVIVGASGTVILAGTPPAELTNGVSDTHCSYTPAGPTNRLSFDIMTDADHPPGTITIDWFTDPAATIPVPAGQITFTTIAGGYHSVVAPPDELPLASNTNIIRTFYARGRDLRTGFTNTLQSVTLRIDPHPTSLVTGPVQVCNGDSNVLQIALTGLGPTWSYVVSSNGLDVYSNPAATRNSIVPIIFSNTNLNAASNAVFKLSSLIDLGSIVPCGGRPDDISNSWKTVINPRPTAIQTSGSTYTACNTNPLYTITNILQGIGPWTVTWNDSFSETVGSGPGPFEYRRPVAPFDPFENAPSNNVFAIAALTDAHCAAIPGDIIGSSSFIINPRPKAILTSTNVPALSLFTITNCGPASYNITNLLTGIGPWTVTWNDTFSETVGAGPGTYEYIRMVTLTNPDANTGTNAQFSITAVTDSNTCTANPALGDIKGTNKITIDPIPTAALLTTNAPGIFATTNCDLPATYNISNILTGIGPWIIFWNDGQVFTNGTGPGPYTNNRTVAPLPLDPNTASNNVFYITNLIATHQCAATSIVGTNSILIYPRPTATLISTNAANNLFATTNCAGSSYNLSNVLTGIGPWYIQWNDGVSYTNGSGPGPFTDVRIVVPTVAAAANIPSNNIFIITNVIDANCVSKAQDIKGTNRITVKEVPTATFILDTNNVSAAVSGNNMIASITNLFGTNIEVVVNFSYTSNHVHKGKTNSTTITVPSVSLVISPKASLTGVPIFTVGFYDGFATNTVHTNGATARTSWSFPILRTSPNTNFTFSLSNLADTNGCPTPATNFAGAVTVNVNQQASAAVSAVLDSICTGDTGQVQVDLSGTSPWTVTWTDGLTQTTNVTPFTRSFANLTNNSTTVASNFVIAITNVSDAVSTNSSISNYAVIQIDPIPAAPPVSSGNVTSCFDVAEYLIVTVPANFTADWYADPTATNLLAFGTTNFAPSAPVTLGTNSVVTNVYYAAARFDDDSLTNACRSSLTAVSLISINCTNKVAVSKTKTNILTQFSGNYILQGATNVLATNWINLATGAPNVLTIITNPLPPSATNGVEFFRLLAPQILP